MGACFHRTSVVAGSVSDRRRNFAFVFAEKPGVVSNQISVRDIDRLGREGGFVLVGKGRE